MARKTFALALGMFVVCTVGTAFTALNSTPDGSRHPALGSFCMKVTEADPWTCFPGSGVLVSADVVLSVAHAGPFIEQQHPAKLGITFDEKISSNPKVYEAYRYVADPQFAWDQRDPHDLAVFLMLDR